MTQDWFNSIAWSDFVMWAFQQPPIREQFTRETGIALPDGATANKPGAWNMLKHETLPKGPPGREDVLLKFVDWVTIHHWGVEHAPPKMRARLASGGS